MIEKKSDEKINQNISKIIPGFRFFNTKNEMIVGKIIGRINTAIISGIVSKKILLLKDINTKKGRIKDTAK